jgi:peptidoglycan hydrolase CwlO-like protein
MRCFSECLNKKNDTQKILEIITRLENDTQKEIKDTVNNLNAILDLVKDMNKKIDELENKIFLIEHNIK